MAGCLCAIIFFQPANPCSLPIAKVQYRHMHKRLLRVAFVLFAIGALYSGTQTYAADESLWRDGQDFTVSTIDGDQSAAYQPCRWTFASAVNIEGVAQQRYGCLASGSSLSLFTYLDDTVSNNQIFGVRIGSDGSFRRLKVHTPHGYRMRLLPGSDTLLVESTANPSATKPKLVLYRLADSPFIAEKAADGINVLNYQLDATKAIPLLGLDHDGTTEYRTVVNYVLSNNRRYMAVWLEYTFLVVVDLETLQSTAIDHLYGAWYGTYASPAAISDDGRYVYVDIKGYMYDTTDCGEKYDNDFLRKSPSQHFPKPCSRAYLSSLISDIDGITSKHHQYRFIDDDTALEFIHPYSGPNKVTTIATEAYDPTRLDYLALGDSYSSGEGDFSIGGSHDNFMPHTDKLGPPRELCHLSKTSYPYLLRDAYAIDSDKMKSVACSGAKTIDVVASLGDYQGQGDRLADVDNIESYRSAAINEFIPGRIPQIEFVRKYKPRVISVGIGGNDAGFADELLKCVKDPLEECAVAANLNNAREQVGQGIMNNFSKLTALYRELREASPESIIYAIGYPQFIKDAASPCLLNGAFVSQSERHFISEAVKQMNAVIQNAAVAQGVQYIDIEDSLVGGRLCEGVTKNYVTGVRSQFYQSIYNEDLRTFLYHPNADGHQKIADRIRIEIGEGIFSEPEIPDDVPDIEYTEYFKSSETYGYYVQSAGNIIKAVPAGGDTITANFEPNTFGYTTTTVTMFSSPRVLGTAMPSPDGSLDFTFTVPADIEPGYHTLVFSGTTMSGDPLEMVHTLFVKGSNPDDIDSDGIADSVDPCLFDAICEYPDKADITEKPALEVEQGTGDTSESTALPVLASIVYGSQAPSDDVATLSSPMTDTANPASGVSELLTSHKPVDPNGLPKSRRFMSTASLLAIIGIMTLILIVTGIHYAKKRQ